METIYASDIKDFSFPGSVGVTTPNPLPNISISKQLK